MSTASVRSPALPPVVFRDSLGERRRLSDATGVERLDILSLRPELTAAPGFETSLRERAARLDDFSHAYFVPVKRIERITDSGSTIAIASDATPGIRLSVLLETATGKGIDFEFAAAASLIRQLVSAVTMLHGHHRNVSHGAINLDRIIVKPTARIVLAEHVLGSALECLAWSRERYWQELHLACDPAPGPPRLDRRCDVVQVGIVALSLFLGRMLTDDEYPSQLSALIASKRPAALASDQAGAPAAFRVWLFHAIEAGPESGFASALDALTALDAALQDNAPALGFQRLEAFVASVRHESRPAVIVPPPPAVEPPAPQPEATPLRVMPFVAGTTESSTSDLEQTPDDERVAEEAPVIAPDPRFGRLNAVLALVGLAAMFGGGAWTARRYLAPAPAVTTTGTVAIATNPVGAQISVDGRAAGVSPLVLTLAAGAHTLEVRGDATARTVPIVVTAGAQASHYMELPHGASESVQPTGWITVVAPREVQLYENGRLLGGSRSDRLLIATGTHQLEIVNEALGFRTTRTVTISPGKVSAISIEFPRGTLALNAIPWAEVWIDGEKVGDTPIGNLPMTIGPHDVVFRNPDLGEQHHSVTVTLTAPARVSADLRKK